MAKQVPHAQMKMLRTIEQHNQAVLALKPKFCGSRQRNTTGIACPQCGTELVEASPQQRVPSNPAMTKVECLSCGYESNVFTV
jgi:hypothetical protein